jgi:hypothetical protein
VSRLRWITIVTVVAFTAGISAALMPAMRPWRSWMELLAAAGLVLGGLIFVSPFAMSQPVNDQQRKVRRRISAMGVASIVIGAGHLMPDAAIGLAVKCLGLVLLVAVVFGSPKRLLSRS